MSERKITCPWCGPEQVMQPVTNEHPLNRQWTAYYMCGECCAGTPNAYGRTEQEAIESAYAAATRRPPNRPLTREQVEAMDDLDAVWVANAWSQSYNASIISAGTAREMYCGRKLWDNRLLFSRRPTPADIEAARKGLDCK